MKFKIRDYKKCESCSVTKSPDGFSKREKICKECKAGDKRNKYQVSKSEDRIQYRNELFRRYVEEGGDLQEFNKFNIPYEKYEVLKRASSPLSFCECEFTRKNDRNNFYDEYKDKIYLDVVMCYHENSNSAYIVHII